MVLCRCTFLSELPAASASRSVISDDVSFAPTVPVPLPAALPSSHPAPLIAPSTVFPVSCPLSSVALMAALSPCSCLYLFTVFSGCHGCIMQTALPQTPWFPHPYFAPSGSNFFCCLMLSLFPIRLHN